MGNREWGMGNELQCYINLNLAVKFIIFLIIIFNLTQPLEKSSRLDRETLTITEVVYYGRRFGVGRS